MSLVCVLLVVLATACRTEVVVDVEVATNGSGTVTVTATLDAEAADALGDPGMLALDDLRQAGWQVPEPRVTDGDGLEVSATRRFSGPDELAGVLEEVGGEDGVFRDVSLEVSSSLAATDYRFGATIVLSGSPEQFGDDALTEALGGLPLGRSAEELAALGADDPGAGTLVLRVDLPGGTPDTDAVVRDGAAVWEAPLTGGEATEEQARVATHDQRTDVLVLGAVGIGLLVAALVALVVGLLRGRRRSA